MMLAFLLRTVVFCVALYLAVTYIPGVSIFSDAGMTFWYTFGTVVILVVIADSFILPVLSFLTIPVRIVTLGISSIFLHGIVLYAITIVSSFAIDGFVTLLLLAVIFTLLRLTLSYVR